MACERVPPVSQECLRTVCSPADTLPFVNPAPIPSRPPGRSDYGCTARRAPSSKTVKEKSKECRTFKTVWTAGISALRSIHFCNKKKTYKSRSAKWAACFFVFKNKKQRTRRGQQETACCIEGKRRRAQHRENIKKRMPTMQRARGHQRTPPMKAEEKKQRNTEAAAKKSPRLLTVHVLMP